MSTGFGFDDAEFQAVLRDWRDLRAQLNQVRRRFANLEHLATRRPADDVASRTFQTRAKRAVNAAKVSDEAVSAYVAGFIARLERTGSVYSETEVASEYEFRRIDTGVDSGTGATS